MAEELGFPVAPVIKRGTFVPRHLDELTSSEFGTFWDAVDALVERFTALMDEYTEVPANAVLAADLDFVTTETAWTMAKNRLVDQGVIGKDGHHYWVR
jgi:hypothetical protein